MNLNEQQKAALIDFLWDHMKRDPEHRDRVKTSYGTKTQAGLCACIERIITENEGQP